MVGAQTADLTGLGFQGRGGKTLFGVSVTLLMAEGLEVGAKD